MEIYRGLKIVNNRQMDNAFDAWRRQKEGKREKGRIHIARDAQIHGLAGRMCRKLV